jgi:hypothetical protein
MVIVFDPTSNGTLAVQFVVPAAIPEAPNVVAQVTDCTPMLSDAVPDIVIEDAVVDTLDEDGDAIVREGAVVSGEAGGGAVVVLVMDTIFET